MQVNPYLSYDGRCEEAFKFYEKALGGRIVAIHRYGGTPMAGEIPEGWGEKVMHTTLDLGNGIILMGSDQPPGRYEAPKGITISVSVKQVEEAERVFAELAESGTVLMPIQQTFWSPRFGMLMDQFGIPWMVNCEQAMAQTA